MKETQHREHLILDTTQFVPDLCGALQRGRLKDVECLLKVEPELTVREVHCIEPTSRSVSNGVLMGEFGLTLRVQDVLATSPSPLGTALMMLVQVMVPILTTTTSNTAKRLNVRETSEDFVRRSTGLE